MKIKNAQELARRLRQIFDSHQCKTSVEMPLSHSKGLPDEVRIYNADYKDRSCSLAIRCENADFSWVHRFGGIYSWYYNESEMQSLIARSLDARWVNAIRQVADLKFHYEPSKLDCSGFRFEEWRALAEILRRYGANVQQNAIELNANWHDYASIHALKAYFPECLPTPTDGVKRKSAGPPKLEIYASPNSKLYFKAFEKLTS